MKQITRITERISLVAQKQTSALHEQIFKQTTPKNSSIHYQLVIPNWQRLVDRILYAPEIESDVQFDRTRDFIERAQLDQIANGCNKENRKKPRLK